MTIPAIYEAPAPLRLDLACGRHPKEGFEGVDLLAPDAKHRVDLFKFPLPWKSESVDEIYCSHFVEHLPAREVEPQDLKYDKVYSARGLDYFLGQDFLFAFFDECYRILRPGCVMEVIVPNASSWRAFQDPTHRRFITRDTFWYLHAESRKAMGLEHYRVTCDFAVTVTPMVSEETTLLHDAVQARRFNHEWNTIHDWHAKLVKK